MEVLACTTRKNKLIHASASRLGPEKLVLSWVRTILNSRMKMVKFCREFMQYALFALGDEFTCLVSVQKMSYCQKFCFLFVCLLRSVAYSVKITNFSVDQTGTFVMGGVAYGIRAHFKQVLSLILILACIFVLFIS